MATSPIPCFRDLYEEINKYRRHLLFWDVLNPWIEKARPAITELSRFKQLSTFDTPYQAAFTSMWNLYALSRVNDRLLLPFQEETKPDRFIAKVTLAEYADFFAQMGFTLVESNRFSPFHQEIVRVHLSKEHDEQIGVLREIWPGLMFGDRLFSRSGVDVIGGRKHVVKEIAEQSTLYFAHRRLNRKTRDLSQGWGSNSQWRTDFRRDYQFGGTWIYNADGKNFLNAQAVSEQDRDGLSREQRVELCRNRCFIKTSKQDDHDLWPFDDRFEEPAWFLPMNAQKTPRRTNEENS